MQFSLFFFSAAGDSEIAGKYQMLLRAVRFADEAGFHAIWIPERHFHSFGGLYPNPAVLGAAVAACTSRVRIRAGSVVLPLHHVARIAEEWSVVDNLSDGRVEVSFASGWQSNDFVLAPENYSRRREMMEDSISQVRALWRGESVSFALSDGQRHEVRVFPRPIQPELPIWLTSVGSPRTAALAGRLGGGLLTHLVGQTFDDLGELVRQYRTAAAGQASGGSVALMLHAFLSQNGVDAVRDAMPPLKDYLRSAADLRAGSANAQLPVDDLTEEDWDVMLSHAAKRYIDNALIGDLAAAQRVVERAAEAGVDEVCCLIDFVESDEKVLASLRLLNELRERVA
jgi:natural product biosynthesis luciferase-like monooxygenase protein